MTNCMKSVNEDKMKLFRICNHCNKEYQLQIFSGFGYGHTFSNCDHCGKRNDVWVRIETVDKEQFTYPHIPLLFQDEIGGKLYFEDENENRIEYQPKKMNMKENKSKLPHSTDARDWAKEFCEFARKSPIVCEDTIMGWFANAIMAGWDEMGRRKAKEDENRWIYVLTNWQTGETIALYSEEPTKEKCDRDYSLHLGQDLEWSVKNVLYTSGQDSAWNCNLHRMKVDSLNRMKEVVEINSLKPYENV